MSNEAWAGIATIIGVLAGVLLRHFFPHRQEPKKPRRRRRRKAKPRPPRRRSRRRRRPGKGGR